jgi:hypothetical protein
MRPALLRLIVLALALTAAARADAWSTPGHSVVAAIAEERLSPAARALVREVLGSTPMSDPDVAGWADAQRDPATKPWHYVNVPLGARGYEAARDCPRGDCVVAAVARAEARLRAGRSARDRADALRWLIHLVADVHQPLHAGDRGDRGGNDLLTRHARGRGQPGNLHRVWDFDVLRPVLHGRDAAAIGRELARSTREPEAAAWASELDPVTWANESHALARRIYAEVGELPRDGRIVLLPHHYARDQRDRVEAQLRKAGVRLAALLDRIARERAGAGGR